MRCIKSLWWHIPCRRGFLGRRMASSCMLFGGCWIWFLVSTPYCTLDGGLGWGWLGCCLFFLPPASFFCGFLPLCLKLTTGFSHWQVQTISVWGILLPWLISDSCLCKLSLQLVLVTLSWSITITLYFLELAEVDCFGHVPSDRVIYSVNSTYLLTSLWSLSIWDLSFQGKAALLSFVVDIFWLPAQHSRSVSGTIRNNKKRIHSIK